MPAIEMTRRGNIRIDGVKHKAVPNNGCDGCVLEHAACGGVVCTRSDREAHPDYKHRVSVIFVKKMKRESPPE